jgi:hypothetical protein
MDVVQLPVKTSCFSQSSWPSCSMGQPRRGHDCTCVYRFGDLMAPMRKTLPRGECAKTVRKRGLNQVYDAMLDLWQTHRGSFYLRDRGHVSDDESWRQAHDNLAPSSLLPNSNLSIYIKELAADAMQHHSLHPPSGQPCDIIPNDRAR